MRTYRTLLRTWIPRIIPLLVALIALSSCAPSAAVSLALPGGDFSAANRQYEAGDFAAAAVAYQALVAAGADDGALYYNLANAYYKSGDLGRALLNYRRAQLHLPRDPDVASNLSLARAQTKDSLDLEADGFAAWVARLLAGWLTLDETAVLALSLWLVVCALAVAAILWPRGRKGLKIALALVALGLVFSVFSLGLRLWDAQRGVPAVVLAESVDARSGPGIDYLSEFALHAGAEIRVIETRAEWARIALPGQLQGWVPESSVETVPVPGL